MIFFDILPSISQNYSIREGTSELVIPHSPRKDKANLSPLHSTRQSLNIAMKATFFLQAGKEARSNHFLSLGR